MVPWSIPHRTARGQKHLVCRLRPDMTHQVSMGEYRIVHLHCTNNSSANTSKKHCMIITCSNLGVWHSFLRSSWIFAPSKDVISGNNTAITPQEHILDLQPSASSQKFRGQPSLHPPKMEYHIVHPDCFRKRSHCHHSSGAQSDTGSLGIGRTLRRSTVWKPPAAMVKTSWFSGRIKWPFQHLGPVVRNMFKSPTWGWRLNLISGHITVFLYYIPTHCGNNHAGPCLNHGHDPKSSR